MIKEAEKERKIGREREKLGKEIISYRNVSHRQTEQTKTAKLKAEHYLRELFNE